MDATSNDLEALAASLASPASSPTGEHELGRLAQAFLDRSDGAELGVGGGSQAQLVRWARDWRPLRKAGREGETKPETSPFVLPKLLARCAAR